MQKEDSAHNVEHEENRNPNSISELLGFAEGLPTTSDKVYRSVSTKAAIDDIWSSGVVRNKQSAGLVERSRWGDRVFWNRGATGKKTPISNNFIIEAPLVVARARVVTSEDITAIYTRDEDGSIINILEQEKADAEARYRIPE